MDFKLIEKTSLIKLDIEEKVIYVKIVWEESENIVFQVKVFDDTNSCWSGCFSAESAEKCRKHVSETEEDYYKNVKMCLTDICNSYIYKFDVNETDTATFEWWRTSAFKDIKIVHGSINLQKDTVIESRNDLINFLFSKSQWQKKALEESNETINDLKLELEKLKAELIKLADIKTSLEDGLYGKFVTLINTKKNRIQALEDYLQKYEN